MINKLKRKPEFHICPNDYYCLGKFKQDLDMSVQIADL